MQIEQVVIPILIKEFTEIYETTIEEELIEQADYRKFRFNLAIIILDLYGQIGKLPYSRILN